MDENTNNFPLARFYGETRSGPYIHRCGARIEMLCSSHPRLHSASPKNVPGPIRAAPRSRSHSVSLKNVHRPIRSLLHRRPHAGQPEECSWTYPGFASAPQPHSVNLINVHRPIRSSLHLLVTRCTPKACFWTHPGFHVRSRSHSVNLKNVPGATPELAPLLAAFCRITLQEVATVSACCVFCQSCRKHASGG